MAATILSLMMLAGLLLAFGGVYQLVKGRGERLQAWLMIVAAVTMFANVAIWAIPV